MSYRHAQLFVFLSIITVEVSFISYTIQSLLGENEWTVPRQWTWSTRSTKLLARSWNGTDHQGGAQILRPGPAQSYDYLCHNHSMGDQEPPRTSNDGERSPVLDLPTANADRELPDSSQHSYLHQLPNINQRTKGKISQANQTDICEKKRTFLSNTYITKTLSERERDRESSFIQTDRYLREASNWQR